MIDTQSSTWTEAFAATKTARYRLVLRVVLLVEAALGLALLLAPGAGASLTGLPEADAFAAWPRLVGLLLLAGAAFAYDGFAHPSLRRWPNLVLIASRVALVVVALTVGPAWPLALWSALAALVLFTTYRQASLADLMAKP